MTTNTKTKVQGIRITEHGGPEVLKYADYELPEPGPGEARVKIHTAGLNFIDIYQRRGRYPVQLPWTPGLEAAGEVEAIGAGVTEVKVGERVAYSSSPGSYAEANIVPAAKLIPLPKELSYEQGAAFPLQGMTAHYLLHEFYKIKKGDNVLIHAAAGGMGLLLVQWAKHLGARVIGTVSSEEKAKLAKEFGADDVIVYTEQDFVKESKRLTNDVGPTYIIDGVGKDTFAKNLDAAALRGHVVIFGAASGVADPILPNDLQKRSLTVYGGSLFNYVLTREELLMRANDVIQGIKEGWLKLKIDQVIPLKEAQKAHELLESRKTVGKVILNCRP
jgi:NADPH2:quinone reductase